MDWAGYSMREKLQILSGETTVMVSLLAENDELMDKLRAGMTQEDALNYINENF